MKWREYGHGFEHQDRSLNLPPLRKERKNTH